MHGGQDRAEIAAVISALDQRSPVPQKDSYCLRLLGGQNALNLLEMIDVVSCEHAGDRFDGFRTSLIVYAVVLPLLRREGLEQREIGLAQRAVLLERFPQVPLLVVQ